MAKVTGPLMSLDASGTVAKTTTFSKWKGRNYVRQRVIPHNPQSAGQQLSRGYLAVLAKAAFAVLTIAKDVSHLGSAFFQAAVMGAPSGQSWISYFQKIQNALVDSDNTAFLALSSTIQGYYGTGATALGLSDYTTVGNTPVTYTAGFQVYELAKFAVDKLAYTGFASGIDSASSAEITAFVTYVSVSA